MAWGLREKIGETPGADNAWFWRVQFHIIYYLLHRFDPDGLRMLEDLPKKASSVESISAAGPAVLEVVPMGSFGVGGGVGKMPRVSREIRPLLANIAEFNRERYELAQRIREELAEAIRGDQERMREFVRQYQACLEAIAEKIEMVECRPSMTDEEIAEILSNAGFLDASDGEGAGSSEDDEPV